MSGARRPRAAVFSRSSGRALRLALALVVSAGGCSLLVDGDLGDVRCLDEGAVGPPACPTGSACKDGLCVERSEEASKLGQPCAVDRDCGPEGLCLDPASFGVEGAPFCSTPCCSSGDCGEATQGLVCWAPGHGGGRFCRPASALDRSRLGPGENGAPCDEAGACRSGTCDGVRCVDTCCSDTNCAAGSVPAACRLASSAGAWLCATPAADQAPYLAACAVDADCASGLCLPILGQLRCSIPCCGSAACGTVTNGADVSALACADVPHGAALVRACAKVLPVSAMGAVGIECTSDEQCRSGLCVEASPTKRACTDVCCTDADCADPAFACRPHVEGSAWVLRCDRK
jgi:hypothetical protein